VRGSRRRTTKYTSESSIGCLLERASRRCYPTTLVRPGVAISVPLRSLVAQPDQSQRRPITRGDSQPIVSRRPARPGSPEAPRPSARTLREGPSLVQAAPRPIFHAGTTAGDRIRALDLAALMPKVAPKSIDPILTYTAAHGPGWSLFTPQARPTTSLWRSFTKCPSTWERELAPCLPPGTTLAHTAIAIRRAAWVLGIRDCLALQLSQLVRAHRGRLEHKRISALEDQLLASPWDPDPLILRCPIRQAVGNLG